MKDASVDATFDFNAETGVESQTELSFLDISMHEKELSELREENETVKNQVLIFYPHDTFFVKLEQLLEIFQAEDHCWPCIESADLPPSIRLSPHLVTLTNFFQ